MTPLREGGSLPAIVEAEDSGLYVLKFRGAGQGPKALIAELIVGELARALGLGVPEVVLMELDPALGRNEADPEVRALLTASGGLNVALDYLPGSLTFDPVASEPIDGALASHIVWLDAFALNVDRTAKNPNLLIWHRKLWLIDHGAALYFHHDWSRADERVRDPFVAIKDHVLLPRADQLEAAQSRALARLEPATFERLVDLVPESWLGADGADAAVQRKAYRAWLLKRRDFSNQFVDEAARARARHV